MKNTEKEPATIHDAKAGALLGKRYWCDKCGTEVICTKAGGGLLTCCGEPMKLKEARPLPSSD